MGPFPSRFSTLYDAPALMVYPERVALYSLVFGAQPERIVEIGTHKGSSAMIMVAALDDLGAGKLVCVDLNPVIAPEHWDTIKHRATMIAGTSPNVLQQAREVAGGLFDLAMIDGDHETRGVIRDIEGVMPFLSDNASMVFHDAYYIGVRNAIDRMVAKHSKTLIDCGMVSVYKTMTDEKIKGEQVIWGGLRLLRYRKPRGWFRSRS